jgi:hypothetical protein
MLNHNLPIILSGGNYKIPRFKTARMFLFYFVILFIIKKSNKINDFSEQLL